MRLFGMWGGILIACIGMMPASVMGQSLVWCDTVTLVYLKQLPGTGGRLIRFRIDQDLEYSLSFSNSVMVNRAQQADQCQMTLLQHLRYRSRFDNCRRLKITSTFEHDLGIQRYPDSVFLVQPDENTLDNRLEVDLPSGMSLSVLSRLSTRFFNSWDYGTGIAGSRSRTLSASFLTPMLWNFSGGFSWKLPGYLTLDFGLTSGRLTYLLNKDVRGRPGAGSIYGIPSGKCCRLEYGLSLHLLVDRDFSGRIHWNCDLMLFKNYLEPADFKLNNQIGIRINKFLRTDLQTRILYEPDLTRKLQLENLVSVGFYVTP